MGHFQETMFWDFPLTANLLKPFMNFSELAGMARFSYLWGDGFSSLRGTMVTEMEPTLA